MAGSIARGLPSALAGAIDDLCEDLDRYRARQERREQLTRCIAAADELIEDLQQLGMDGQSVPEWWQPRLDRFAAELPSGVPVGLRSEVGPRGLLDQLFEVEERLLQLKLEEWARTRASGGPATWEGERPDCR